MYTNLEEAINAANQMVMTPPYQDFEGGGIADKSVCVVRANKTPNNVELGDENYLVLPQTYVYQLIDITLTAEDILHTATA